MIKQNKYMTKNEKMNAVIGIGGLCLIVLLFVFKSIILPWILIQKVENKQFKTTCAYVIGKEKIKYGYKHIVKINSDLYHQFDIMPNSGIILFKHKTLRNFPIVGKSMDFFHIEPDKCKKIKYIEINFIWFKKIYLYDFIN